MRQYDGSPPLPAYVREAVGEPGDVSGVRLVISLHAPAPDASEVGDGICGDRRHIGVDLDDSVVPSTDIRSSRSNFLR